MTTLFLFKVLAAMEIASSSTAMMDYSQIYTGLSLTNYDKSLMETLIDGNDFKFYVKTLDKKPQAVSEFPTLSDNNKSDALEVTTAFGRWTWSCRIYFLRDKDSRHLVSIQKSDASRIITAGKKGYLGKLTDNSKKPGSKKDKILKLRKINFIRKCAAARGVEKNEKINREDKLKNNKIISNVIVTLAKGGKNKSWGKDPNKLYFKNRNKFDYWFPRS